MQPVHLRPNNGVCLATPCLNVATCLTTCRHANQFGPPPSRCDSPFCSANTETPVAARKSRRGKAAVTTWRQRLFGSLDRNGDTGVHRRGNLLGLLTAAMLAEHRMLGTLNEELHRVPGLLAFRRPMITLDRVSGNRGLHECPWRLRQCASN